MRKKLIPKLAPIDAKRLGVRTKQSKKGDFRCSVLPKPNSGWYCLAVKGFKNGENFLKTYWFESKNVLFESITKYDVEGVEVFVAEASFESKEAGRKQKNAAFLKNFFLDIDCGEGKPYKSQDEGKEALLSFCEKTGLPIPAIVNSGNGLYAHFRLTSSVPAGDWRTTAKELKKLVAVVEPGLDNDGIIADSARLLRPIGSTHRKDPTNPKRVTLLQDCEPINFSQFKNVLNKALAEISSEQTCSDKVGASENEDAIQDKTSKATKIVEKCAVIGMLKNSGGNVPEPLWYACIGVLRHCEEAPDIIHDWSKGYTDYSKNETDSKIAQHTMPPTTCGKFAEMCPDLCDKCKCFGKIKSPIVLGLANTSTDEIPSFVENLNKEYFVSRYGSKTVVCREAYDTALKRQIVVMSTFADFKNYFCNRKVEIGMDKNGNPLTTPLGKAWLEHHCRRQYKDIVMRPEGIDGTEYYNLWRGFSVQPQDGSWKLIRKHISEVICNADKKVFRYVLRWLARMIQQPWTPGEVALVIQGNKGIGKGMLVNTLCRILGQHSMSIYNGKHLVGNFNAHLEDCILLYVDEAFWAGDKGGESVLKGLITEPTMPIERKGLDLKSVRNLLHIIMSSNNDWVVPASLDERRYCVLKASDRYVGNFEYFKALKHEIENGGMEAMLHYLQNKDISSFNVRDIPITSGLTEQKILSLDPLMKWWYVKLQDGELLPGYEWGPVPFAAFFEDYLTSIQKLGGNVRRSDETSFAMQLRKVLPKNSLKTARNNRRSEGRRGKYYNFPSLKTCRKQFQKLLGDDSLKWSPLN